MPSKVPQTSFRVGPTGACEAHLYQFVAFHDPDVSVEDGLQLIAAVDISDALAFLKNNQPNFRVRIAQDLGVVLLVSGSPYA